MEIDVDSLPQTFIKIILVLGFGLILLSFPFEKISMMSKLVGMVGVGAIMYFIFKEKSV